MRTGRLLLLALVVVALGAFIWFFERHQPTVDERRERAERLFPALERDDVIGLEVSNEHGTFRLARHGDDWRLVEPVEAAADEIAISSLLGTLVGLSAERRFAAGEVEPSAYGLDEPELTVALTDEAGKRRELRIGQETALGSDRAVSVDGGEVTLVRGWFASDLRKDLDGWRSKDVVDVATERLASLQIVSGEDRIQAVRDGGRWRLLEPVVDLADRDHVRNFVADLNSLRVEEFLPPDADPEELGLVPPAHTVTLVGSDGGETTVLELGATRERDGATQVACRRDGAELYWVNDRGQVALGRAPVRWRSSTVLPFDSWNVEAMSVSDGERAVELERRDGLWKLADGGEVDGGAVLDRIAALAGLEAVDYDLVAPGTPEMGRVVITLAAEGEEDAETVTFTFHRPLTEDGLAVVEVSARASRVSVDGDAAAKIVGDPGALVRQATPTPEPETAEVTAGEAE